MNTYGKTDRLPCPKCGGVAQITRRSPNGADRRLEDQTFTCVACDHEFGRVVDGAGKPPSPPLSVFRKAS